MPTPPTMILFASLGATQMVLSYEPCVARCPRLETIFHVCPPSIDFQIWPLLAFTDAYHVIVRPPETEDGAGEISTRLFPASGTRVQVTPLSPDQATAPP